MTIREGLKLEAATVSSAAHRRAVEAQRATYIDPGEFNARIELAQREIEVRGLSPTRSQESMIDPTPGLPGQSPWPPPPLAPLSESASQKLTEAYNAVVRDGRYLRLFRDYPQEAARFVGVDLPEEAANAVRRYATLAAASNFESKDPSVRAGPIYVVAVAVVVVASKKDAIQQQEVVVDSSGMLKL